MNAERLYSFIHARLYECKLIYSEWIRSGELEIQARIWTELLKSSVETVDDLDMLKDCFMAHMRESGKSPMPKEIIDRFGEARKEAFRQRKMAMLQAREEERRMRENATKTPGYGQKMLMKLRLKLEMNGQMLFPGIFEDAGGRELAKEKGGDERGGEAAAETAQGIQKRKKPLENRREKK